MGHGEEQSASKGETLAGRVPPTAPGRSRKICIVSSCGGHLTEVRALTPAFETYETLYVLNDRLLLPKDMENRTLFVRHSERDWLFFVNLLEAWRILRRERPCLILSTGAGPVVPFSLVGKLLGVPTVFVETLNRVTKPSLTGRIMYRLADRFFYQWRSLEKEFPRGTYAGTVLWCGEDHHPKSPPREVEGLAPTDRLVFVTVGNATQGFRRLLDAVDRLAGDGLFGGARVIVQCGHASGFSPSHCLRRDFLPMDDFVGLIRRAEIVITHVGAGTLLHVITAGKTPIVMPRRAKYRELVDDHQLQLLNALVSEGSVIAAAEPEDLPAAVEEARRRSRLPARSSQPPIIAMIRSAIDELTR